MWADRSNFWIKVERLTSRKDCWWRQSKVRTTSETRRLGHWYKIITLKTKPHQEKRSRQEIVKGIPRQQKLLHRREMSTHWWQSKARPPIHAPSQKTEEHLLSADPASSRTSRKPQESVEFQIEIRLQRGQERSAEESGEKWDHWPKSSQEFE